MWSFVRKSRANTILVVFCISYSAFILWGAADIPPAFFDTLGSAAVPIGCALIVIFLSVLLVFQNRKPQPSPIDEPTGAPYRQRWDKAAGIVLLTLSYVGSMSLGWLGFSGATAAFLFLSIVLLGGVSKQIVIVALLLAVFLGFGGHYLFTEVFFIDLPN